MIFITALISLAYGSLEVVQNFQVPAYLGNWYEVASSPIVHWTFESNGYCVRATYGLLSNGELSVTNIMRKGSPTGPIDTIVGTATANPSSPAELEVQFPGTPQAPYWVAEVGPIVGGQYQWAIVSGPTKTFMWVLARNVEEYNTLYATDVQKRVKALGFTNLINKYVPRSWEGCTPY